MGDQKFLMWLHEQLTEKYGWNPLVGHLHTLRAIIYDMSPSQKTYGRLVSNDLAELRGAIARKETSK